MPDKIYRLIFQKDDGTEESVEFTAPQGPKGDKGDTGETGAAGKDGAAGQNGKDGVPATHSWNGTTLTVTSASGTSSANLKGEKGDQGDTGEQGPKGDKGDTGAPGANGKDGTSATHSWNGTVLTVTSASGTSSADLKGEKGDKGDTGATGPKGDTGPAGADGAKGEKGDKGDQGIQGIQGIQGEKGDKGDTGADGVSISSVKQTTTSSADGGSNVVTVTLSDGTTSTFTVKNGSKGSAGTNGTNGKDGKTPVKGVDYWTQADQEAIVQDVIAALGTPVFGRVDAANNIILTGELADGEYTIKYEDADGTVTEIGTFDTDPGPAYTNWIPKAINTDGTIYNSVGYKKGVRYSASSGTETTSSAENIYSTGFIPVKAGDVIRVKNITIFKGSSVTNAHHIIRFPSLSLTGGANADMASSTDAWQIVWDNNNHLVQCTIPSDRTVAYIRVQAEYIGADSILTINEPME